MKTVKQKPSELQGPDISELLRIHDRVLTDPIGFAESERRRRLAEQDQKNLASSGNDENHI